MPRSAAPSSSSFVVQPTMGSTQGTGVNHISFSFADLPAKMAALEKVGVRGIGVRFQRFDGRRDVPRRSRVVQATASSSIRGGRGSSWWRIPSTLGFHHIHLSATDPDATLKWYQNDARRHAGQPEGTGERAAVRQRLAARRASRRRHAGDHEGARHRSHRVRRQGVGRGGGRSAQAACHVLEQPAVPQGGRTRGEARARRRAGQRQGRGGRARLCRREGASARLRPSRPTGANRIRRRAPRGASPICRASTPATRRHGIPLERPKDLADVKTLTRRAGGGAARARHAGQHLGLRAGVARHDARLREDGAVHAGGDGDRSAGRPAPADDAGGRKTSRGGSPSRRERGGCRAGATANGMPRGPEDLSPFVRCITRGLPGHDDADGLQQRPADRAGARVSSPFRRR